MTVNELLDLASDIRIKLDEVRAKRQLTFEEKGHKYSMFDPNKNKTVDDLPSVSTVLKDFYEEFDSLEASLRKANGDVKMAEELRESWNKMGDDASSVGSYAHFKLEQYVWSLYDINMHLRKPEYTLNNEELLLAQSMVLNGVNLIHRITEKGFVPLETEAILGSVDLGYFGQCDNTWLGIHKNQISILMTDHKSNKTKNFETKPYNKPMKAPFDRLPDTALSKYYIQQPLYAQLLKDMLNETVYKDIPIVAFRILHLRDGGKMYKIPMWVYDEVQKLYPLK
jgi:hypothetical protein